MEQTQKDVSGAPEESTGVQSELAGEVKKEEEEPIQETGSDVVPPPPPARRMRAWDYWTT